MRNTVIWWNIYPYLYDGAGLASWRHLSCEARGPKARPIVEYPKSQNTNMDFLHTPRIKITRMLSIDALLSPSLRNVWGSLSGPRLLLHCSNERLEYYAARG